jgi:hypothetical protein
MSNNLEQKCFKNGELVGWALPIVDMKKAGKAHPTISAKRQGILFFTGKSGGSQPD